MAVALLLVAVVSVAPVVSVEFVVAVVSVPAPGSVHSTCCICSSFRSEVEIKKDNTSLEQAMFTCKIKWKITPVALQLHTLNLCK